MIKLKLWSNEIYGVHTTRRNSVIDLELLSGSKTAGRNIIGEDFTEGRKIEIGFN